MRTLTTIITEVAIVVVFAIGFSILALIIMLMP